MSDKPSAELINALAGIFGQRGPIALDSASSNDDAHPTLTLDDGIKVHARAGYKSGDRDKWIISANVPWHLTRHWSLRDKASLGVESADIRVRMDKSPAEIAREVERRLLPGVRHGLATLNEYNVARLARIRQRNRGMEEFAAAAGLRVSYEEAPVGHYCGEPLPQDEPRAAIGSHPYLVDGEYETGIEFEPRDEGTLSIKFRSAPPALAARWVNELRAHYAATAPREEAA